MKFDKCSHYNIILQFLVHTLSANFFVFSSVYMNDKELFVVGPRLVQHIPVLNEPVKQRDLNVA